jgi:hypothetical protein
VSAVGSRVLPFRSRALEGWPADELEGTCHLLFWKFCATEMRPRQGEAEGGATPTLADRIMYLSFEPQRDVRLSIVTNLLFSRCVCKRDWMYVVWSTRMRFRPHSDFIGGGCFGKMKS